MTIGVVIFIIFTFIGVALSQGRADAALAALGYFTAFVGITILIVFGCVTAYTLLIHHLWTM